MYKKISSSVLYILLHVVMQPRQKEEGLSPTRHVLHWYVYVNSYQHVSVSFRMTISFSSSPVLLLVSVLFCLLQTGHFVGKYFNDYTIVYNAGPASCAC